jgi:hypothetical protein
VFIDVSEASFNRSGNNLRTSCILFDGKWYEVLDALIEGKNEKALLCILYTGGP